MPNLRILDISDNPIGYEPPAEPPAEPEVPFNVRDIWRSGEAKTGSVAEFTRRLDRHVASDFSKQYYENHPGSEGKVVYWAQGASWAEDKDQVAAEFKAFRARYDAWLAAKDTWTPPPPKMQTGLPDSIGRMKQLEELHVARCGITGLPDSIGDLGELRVLDVSGNPISRLPDTMSRLTKLEVLVADAMGSLPDLSKAPLKRLDMPTRQLDPVPAWLLHSNAFDLDAHFEEENRAEEEARKRELAAYMRLKTGGPEEEDDDS